MFKMSIKPQWQLEGADAVRRPLLPLIELLTAVHDAGTLSGASRRLSVSYRYAWDLIQRGSQTFGAPLLVTKRGRSATLSVLGKKLLWANKRIAARLAPTLDSLASELEVEIERVLSESKPSIRIHASHGFAIEMLRDFLATMNVPMDLKYRNSMEALASLAGGNCDVAGFHVPSGKFQAAALKYYVKWLKPGSQTLIDLATRRLGIMAAPGNPKQILSIADLAKPGVRFVNRQFGSGTRILLELLLKQQNVDSSEIEGYDSGEFTHASVAAYVASGMADAGFGVETGARRFGLDFIPVASERYFLVCRSESLASPIIARIRNILSSTQFRAAAAGLPGIDVAHAGTMLSISEAFPDLPAPAKNGRKLQVTSLHK
jgi:molybdate transport repressor ModE-like protein